MSEVRPFANLGQGANWFNRFRDEVLKRAMVQGLVALPRPTSREPRKSLVRAVAVVLALGVTVAGWFVARGLVSVLGASP